jgi:integrase
LALRFDHRRGSFRVPQGVCLLDTVLISLTLFFGPVRPAEVRKPWVAALKRAEIAYFPVYCLRATFASRLSAAGVPDVFVSQLMGHAGGLLQTYAKAITEYRRDAVKKLEEYRQSKAVNENTPTITNSRIN